MNVHEAYKAGYEAGIKYVQIRNIPIYIDMPTIYGRFGPKLRCTIPIRGNQLLGEIAWTIALKEKPINSPYIKINGKKKFFGYDYPFNKRIAEFPELMNAKEFFIPFPFDRSCNHASLYPPLFYFKQTENGFSLIY